MFESASRGECRLPSPQVLCNTDVQQGQQREDRTLSDTVTQSQDPLEIAQAQYEDYLELVQLASVSKPSNTAYAGFYAPLPAPLTLSGR